MKKNVYFSFLFSLFFIFYCISSCNNIDEQKNDQDLKKDSLTTNDSLSCQLNFYQWKVEANVYKDLLAKSNPPLRKLVLTPSIKDFSTKFNIEPYTYAWGKDSGVNNGTILNEKFGTRGNITLLLNDITPPLKFSSVEFRRGDINAYLVSHGVNPNHADNDLWFLPFVDETNCLNYYLVPIPKNTEISDTNTVKNFLPDSIKIAFPHNHYVTFTFTGASANGLLNFSMF